MKRPAHLTTELLTKNFMELTADRYPSSDKVLQMIARMGVAGPGASPLQEVNAKIIVLSRFRDAIRQVSPNHIFRNIQHRDDVFNAIIEALEHLEDELDRLTGEQEQFLNEPGHGAAAA